MCSLFLAPLPTSRWDASGNKARGWAGGRGFVFMCVRCAGFVRAIPGVRVQFVEPCRAPGLHALTPRYALAPRTRSQMRSIPRYPRPLHRRGRVADVPVASSPARACSCSRPPSADRRRYPPRAHALFPGVHSAHQAARQNYGARPAARRAPLARLRDPWQEDLRHFAVFRAGARDSHPLWREGTLGGLVLLPWCPWWDGKSP